MVTKNLCSIQKILKRENLHISELGLNWLLQREDPVTSLEDILLKIKDICESQQHLAIAYDECSNRKFLLSHCLHNNENQLEEQISQINEEVIPIVQEVRAMSDGQSEILSQRLSTLSNRETIYFSRNGFYSDEIDLDTCFLVKIIKVVVLKMLEIRGEIHASSSK